MVAYLDGVVDKVVDDDTGNHALIAAGRRDKNQKRRNCHSCGAQRVRH